MRTEDEALLAAAWRVRTTPDCLETRTAFRLLATPTAIIDLLTDIDVARVRCKAGECQS